MGAGNSYNALNGLIQQRQVCAVLVSVIMVLLAGCGQRFIPALPEDSREQETSAGVGAYSIQVGLYDTQKEAEQVAEELAQQFGLSTTILYKPPFYRVHLETDGDEKSVDAKVDSLKTHGFDRARRVFKYEQ